MEIELEGITKVTLQHRHVADYLAETDPLDRAVLLRKGLEVFTLGELNTLEGYICHHLGGAVANKAATLAVCRFARELLKETDPEGT